jgi:hypothetical protein
MLIDGSKACGSTTFWWYANRAPAIAAQNPEMAKAASRARCTLTP